MIDGAENARDDPRYDTLDSSETWIPCSLDHPSHSNRGDERCLSRRGLKVIGECLGEHWGSRTGGLVVTIDFIIPTRFWFRGETVR